MRSILAGLCCLTLAASGAHAATSNASAQLGTLHFSVTDLDLTDGVTADYSLLQSVDGPAGNGRSVARFGAADVITVENRVEGPETFGAYVPVSALSAAAQARVTLVPGGATAEASAIKDNAFAESGALSSTGYLSSAPYAFTLELTANTALTITMDAATLASAGTVCGILGDFCGSAASFVSLSGRMRVAGEGTTESVLRSDAGFLSGSAFDAKTGLLTITLFNHQAFTNSGWLDTSVYSTASVVPEPETYALMLAGLALIAGLRRRRSVR
ncbi:PEP-CTERM sorting domain-containing protein [Piscinibacter terrae]|uniref:PEP-CTERM sorting domain-containing protein n=1 Tax=Piscinibacter terrae TaxID=2496871 RepID=A0A3N7HKA9_9BURK|nr:PEP-CTERM sorting domain-containing protein [Albitalea terrae]RQP22517.1 PEP-CTERM sorting domain-containing protein [Albitalea terrae]